MQEVIRPRANDEGLKEIGVHYKKHSGVEVKSLWELCTGHGFAFLAQERRRR